MMRNTMHGSPHYFIEKNRPYRRFRSDEEVA